MDCQQNVNYSWSYTSVKNHKNMIANQCGNGTEGKNVKEIEILNLQSIPELIKTPHCLYLVMPT